MVWMKVLSHFEETGLDIFDRRDAGDLVLFEFVRRLLVLVVISHPFKFLIRHDLPVTLGNVADQDAALVDLRELEEHAVLRHFHEDYSPGVVSPDVDADDGRPLGRRISGTVEDGPLFAGVPGVEVIIELFVDEVCEVCEAGIEVPVNPVGWPTAEFLLDVSLRKMDVFSCGCQDTCMETLPLDAALGVVESLEDPISAGRIADQTPEVPVRPVLPAKPRIKFEKRRLRDVRSLVNKKARQIKRTNVRSLATVSDVQVPEKVFRAVVSAEPIFTFLPSFAAVCKPLLGEELEERPACRVDQLGVVVAAHQAEPVLYLATLEDQRAT